MGKPLVQQTCLADGDCSRRHRAKADFDYRYLVAETPRGRIAVGENVERQEELQDIMRGGMQAALLQRWQRLAGLWLAIGGARLRAINEGSRRSGAAVYPSGGNDDLSLLANGINLTTERLERDGADAGPVLQHRP